MRKLRVTAVLATAALLFAAGCSSDDDDANTGAVGGTDAPAATDAPEDTAAAPAATDATEDSVDVVQGSDITLAVITHGDDGVFWSVAQKGAEQAGEDLGITVQYQGANNDASTQSQMIEQAVADGVDGVAISLADPDALEAAAQSVVDAGIPLITLNSGSDRFKELGAITHVGQDETIAGNGAGERFAAESKTHLLCVMQEQSNVGLQARCDGAEETFGGEVTTITTSGDADPTTSQQEIKAALEADDTIDAVFATGPIGAVLAVAAAEELGRDVMIGSVDLSEDLLSSIEAGAISFTIDQQQYLQGYLSVVFLYLNITNANTVGGGLPVNTGPGFVTADNVASVTELVAAGTR
ncbi:MAG: sugar ABC transporter substrate-binding protein [Acidimicrobiia bacterium]